MERDSDEVMKEHANFVSRNAITAIHRRTVPRDVTVVGTTWAMKKKADGTYKARCNAQGFTQIHGQNHFNDNIASPTVSDVSVKLITGFMGVYSYTAHVVDAKGVFLLANFSDGEEVYMNMPQGWEELYEDEHMLRLEKTVYGTKQACKAFWN